VPTCNATSKVLLRFGWSVSSVHLNSSGDEEEVAARRDRQELREALHEAEHDRVEDRHGPAAYVSAVIPRHRGGVLGRDERQGDDARCGREGEAGRVVVGDEERDPETSCVAPAGACLHRGGLVIRTEHEHSSRRHDGRRAPGGGVVRLERHEHVDRTAHRRAQRVSRHDAQGAHAGRDRSVQAGAAAWREVAVDHERPARHRDCHHAPFGGTG
jgi:hypothetical protein